MYFFVEAIGNKIAGIITVLSIIAVIGAISLVSWVGYGIYSLCSRKSNDIQIIESSNKIVPTTKLHTDGKTIDTLYVYTFKK